MSMIAMKLYEERDNKKEDYAPLLRALFGSGEYSPALNENQDFAQAVEDALQALDESSVFGLLQRYFVEEYFLHGKSKEAIGKEIADNMDLLLADLEHSSIRFLRHPKLGKPLQSYIKK